MVDGLAVADAIVEGTSEESTSSCHADAMVEMRQVSFMGELADADAMIEL